MPDSTDRDREARLREAAALHGLSLQKSRLGNLATVEYSAFMLVDEKTGSVVDTGSEGGYLLNLDEVEQYLDSETTGADGSQTDQ
ncbi:MAG: hypothetical protein JWR34_4321 [Mycobacterium sp.]|nr:hypothetical protein [Mycobacterium sp.]